MLAVHVVFTTADGRVLMLRRANTGWCDGQFSLVAGHVLPGEDMLSAAVRESFEEIGVRVPRRSLAAWGMYHRRADDGDRIDVFFDALSFVGSPRNAEPGKASELVWLASDELAVRPVVEYVRAALATRGHSPFIASYGWE